MGATVNRIPGVRYSAAYSFGSDPPGVTTVNAGEAMNGTSMDTAAPEPVEMRHAKVACVLRPPDACLVALRSRESVNGRRPPPTAATGCGRLPGGLRRRAYSVRRIVMRATGLRQSNRAALRFPMP